MELALFRDMILLYLPFVELLSMTSVLW